MLSLLSRSRLYRSFRQLNLRPAPELNPWRLVPCARTMPLPTPALGQRMFATSTDKTRKAAGPRRSVTYSSYKLRTLRPERLSIAGQGIIDLSGKGQPKVPTLIDPQPTRCIYDISYKSGTRTYPRFPKNTRGVFYYHNPTDGHEFNAGVRFRLCESVAEFERGRDLLDPRGDVWGPGILDLVKLKRCKGFLSLLRAENLIDEALVNDIHKIDGILKKVRQCHYLLSDPFYLDIAHTKRTLAYITRTKAFHLQFPQKIFAAWAGTSHVYPLTGSIKVQFEVSDLAEHRELGPTLVIRVLEVIDPIVVDPLYTGDRIPPIPVPGTLLLRNAYERSNVVHIPLKRQPMAADLLELMKASWPGA
ncbi:hypothetical protein BJ912DRAFT_110188 [Pholiota molesta]|nr:hypothetical protein BJ912DRAFT_110188 [Pholiota molesta]